jgi:hypothetical protein
MRPRTEPHPSLRDTGARRWALLALLALCWSGCGLFGGEGDDAQDKPSAQADAKKPDAEASAEKADAGKVDPKAANAKKPTTEATDTKEGARRSKFVNPWDKAKKADAKQADAKQADAKQADAKQADAKKSPEANAQAVKADAKADAKQADTKQADAKADAKQAEAQAPAPIREETLTLNNALTRNLIKQATGYRPALRPAPLAGQSATPAYNFMRLQPGTRRNFGVSLQIWREDNPGAQSRFFNELLRQYPEARRARALGDSSFQAGWEELHYLAWLDRKKRYIAVLTCDKRICTKDKQTTALARKLADRLPRY